MSKRPIILVKTGELSGKTFSVPQNGLRLGRSSTSDLSIPDEELSRNHCLFEQNGEDGISVIDLGSANGTFVNGDSIESEIRILKIDDEISVGTTILSIVASKDDNHTDDKDTIPLKSSSTSNEVPKTVSNEAPKIVSNDQTKGVDLGFGATNSDGLAVDNKEGNLHKKTISKKMRLVLSIISGVLIVAMVIVLCLGDKVGEMITSKKDNKKEKVSSQLSDEIIAFSYEKVDADMSRIFRYSAELDEEGWMHVGFDDVPDENRHMSKSIKLKQEQIDRLFNFLNSNKDKWDSLSATYYGGSVDVENALKSYRLRIVRANDVKEVVIENRLEPPDFRAIREQLEICINNELGMESIHRSRADLLKSSAHHEQIGDEKWGTRDADAGNISEALRNYKLAKEDLKSLGVVGADNARLQEKIDLVDAELTKRYMEVRDEAIRCKNIGDWENARDAYMRIRNMIPFIDDERNSDAENNLKYIGERLGEIQKRRK